MSTRPRITFDERGWCNACQWMEEKKTFDWEKREEELIDFRKHNMSMVFVLTCAVSDCHAMIYTTVSCNSHTTFPCETSFFV